MSARRQGKGRPVAASEGEADRLLLRRLRAEGDFAALEREVLLDAVFRAAWLRDMARKAYRATRRKAGKRLSADQLMRRIGDFGMREWLLYDVQREKEQDARTARHLERVRAGLEHGPANRAE